MCVSLQPAHFSDTIVGVFEDRTGRRYLAYQNTAANLVTRPAKPESTFLTRSGPANSAAVPAAHQTRSGAGKADNWSFETASLPAALPTITAPTGNALILPIADDMANIEVIDTSSCPKFLKDIRSAIMPRTRGDSDGLLSFSTRSKSVRIIEFDIYTIVIAENAGAIAKAIQSDAVSPSRRPALNPEIIEAYTRWYPGWAIAVCCFDNNEAQEGKPLLFSYEPSKQDPEYFFVPTLDSHDGKVPNLTGAVEVDHTIFVATADMKDSLGPSVYYSDDIAPTILERLPRKVVGKQLRGSLRNGDIVFRRSDLAAGQFRGLRALPPGAEEKADQLFV